VCLSYEFTVYKYGLYDFIVLIYDAYVLAYLAMLLRNVAYAPLVRVCNERRLWTGKDPEESDPYLV
jgi:hypothetical protein